MTSAGWLETIFSLSAQASLLIVITAMLARRQGLAPHAHRLWAACHAALLFLVALAFGFPHLRIITLTFESSLGGFWENVHSVENILGLVLELLWGIGVIISLLVLTVGSISTWVYLRNSQPINNRFCTKQIGTRKVLIRSHPRIYSPFCWQIHQPIIILPEHILSLPDSELEMIIRHEYQHLKAAHPLHLFLQRLVEAVFWFHPLIWWSSRRAVCSREFHCDNHSVSSSDDAIVYLQCLLRLAKQRHTKWSPLTNGFSFTTQTSLIQQRATRLATRDWNSPNSSSKGNWGFLAILGTTILVTILWIPLDVYETNRSVWSPWPSWSSDTLHSFGISVRDYEIDSHRLRAHH